MRRSLPVWFVVCAAVTLGASPSFAQGLGYGVKGGVNVANVDVAGAANGTAFDPRYGIVAGGFVTMRLSSWFDVQAEGLYSEKGSRLKAFGADSKLIVDYVEVPVLARVRLAKLFYAAGGPSMGFRVQAKTRTRFDGSTEEMDITDKVEPFDFGVAVGGGVELGALVIDGRYTLGLSDIDKETGSDSTTKNRVLSFTLGIRF